MAARLPPRAKHRAELRTVSSEALLAAGRYREAITVVTDGVRKELAAVLEARPDEAPAIYTDIVRAVAKLAATIPVYKPVGQNGVRG